MLREFTAVVEGRKRGGISLRVPFDPAMVWGARERFDVTGTIGGHRVRGKLTQREGGYYLEMGPAWCRDEVLSAGTEVQVALQPEGPQVALMDEDIAVALNAQPEARRFFEALPTFYRKNFMRWIQDAKQPQTRARRIAETVALLKDQKRER
jgi:hypothetical protein